VASNAQIFLVLLIGWIAIFALGWQAYEFFKDRTIECDWNKCKYNKNGICRCKHIVMKDLPCDNHFYGLYCSNFSPSEIEHIDTKI